MSILLELFDRKVEWEILLDTRSAVRAQFVLGELVYEVTIDGQRSMNIELEEPHEMFDDIWEIHFALHGHIDQRTFHSSTKVTGTGNSILVFSTVIDIIKYAVESKNIQTLNIIADADQPTRVKLYKKLALHFSENGWRYIGNEEIYARSSERQRMKRGDYDSNILTKHPKPVSESILLELFDKFAPYEWESMMGVPAATFEVEDVPYLVAFMPYEANFLNDSKSLLPRKYETVMGAMIANYLEGDLESGNYLSGSGNEFLVFSTAIKIFEEYLQKEQPEAFAVAALVAEGRDVTYAKMAKRLAMRMKKSGYTLVDEETMMGTQFGEMHVFYVLRNDLKEEWLNSQGETLSDTTI